MPHSHKSSRANLLGVTPRPRVSTGQSVAQSNAAERSKILGTSAAPIYSPKRPKGPRLLRFASDAQQEVFNYGPFPLAASGGFGSGKTMGLCMKAMYLSGTYPGNRGLIARKQVKKLEMTTMKTFWKVCPPEAYAMGSRSDQAKKLVLNNGSEIIWSQLDDSEILEMLRGLEINWFLIDQAEEVSEEIFEVLLRRLGRWDQAEVPQYLLDMEHAAGRVWPWINKETGQPLPPTYGMIAVNPDHELHWVYRRFHEKSPEWEETYRDQGYKMFHFDSTKNIFLPDQNRDQLMKGTKEFIARFVHGEWGIPEGQIHKIDPISLLRWSEDLDHYIHTQCKLSRTLDHGESSPTCCIWWALDRYGNLFAYREYYQPDRLISFHRQRIYEMSLVKSSSVIGGIKEEVWIPEKYASDIADPSIFTPRTQRGISVSVAEEYMEINEAQTDKHSAVWWQRGDNNELGTRNRINEFLRLDPDHKHPFTGKPGAPRLYFVERSSSYSQGCFELIRETRSARRVKVGTQDGKDVFSDERDIGIVDHAYDCTSGSTLVITPDGQIPISALPKEGWVLTPVGWRHYVECRKYRSNSPVVEVQFDDGRSVVTTPDHLFQTSEGWVKAEELTNKTVCGIVTKWTPSCSPLQNRYSQESLTTVADCISSVKGFVFTALFGNMHMAQFHLNTTSTTRMKIEPTTGCEILSVWMDGLISQTIVKVNHMQKLWQRCRKLLKRGIEVLSGALGIGSTTRKTWRMSTPVMSENVVWSVKESSLLRDCVQRGQNIVDQLVVQPVSAQPIRVITVSPRSSEDVYCLTVLDEEAAFCVEGGIIIHNCLRYRSADMDALPVEAIRRPPPGSVDHCIAEFKRSDLRRGRKRMDGTSRTSDLAKLPPKLADFFRGRRL